MITHQIVLKPKVEVEDPYEDAWDNFNNYYQRPRPGYLPQSINAIKKLDKLSYSQYIGKLKCRVGDFMVVNNLDINSPEAQNVWRWYVVKDIQEIHHLADYMTDLEPKCCFMQALSSYSGGVPPTPFWSNPNLYKVVDIQDVPQVVKDSYDHAQNHSKQN